MSGDASLYLDRLCEGDANAAERLMPLVYEELRALAQTFLRQQRPGHTLQPTALVHEAYLKLVGTSATRWEGRAHFMAVAARAMRQILINHARGRGAEKRGGDRAQITLDRVLAAVESDIVDIVALEDAMLRLGELNERQSRVVELRIYGGLTIEEAALVLHVGPTTVKADWQMARPWLKRQLAGSAT